MRGSSEQANKQLAQIIVENFRHETDYRRLSQSVLNEVEEEFSAHCLRNNLTPKQTHMTLLIRNFNFPLPNARVETNVRFNPIVQQKTLKNDAESSRVESAAESMESSPDPSRAYDKNRRIKPYVDFTCYYENVDKGRKNGTLPSFIKWEREEVNI